MFHIIAFHCLLRYESNTMKQANIWKGVIVQIPHIFSQENANISHSQRFQSREYFSLSRRTLACRIPPQNFLCKLYFLFAKPTIEKIVGVLKKEKDFSNNAIGMRYMNLCFSELFRKRKKE